jgi:hypothetical protein
MKQITLRLSDEKYAALCSYAEKRNMSLQLLMQQLIRKGAAMNKSITLMKAMLTEYKEVSKSLKVMQEIIDNKDTLPFGYGEEAIMNTNIGWEQIQQYQQQKILDRIKKPVQVQMLNDDLLDLGDIEIVKGEAPNE